VPKPNSLDSLLPAGEPHASFHDAIISVVRVDYVARQFLAQAEICVGDPNASDPLARERRRKGELVVDGLKIWVLEAPDPISTDTGDGLWITTVGVLSDSPTESGKALAKTLAPNDVGWFLFINNLNAFGYVAGSRAAFHWL